MNPTWKIVGINFDHMHMGDLLRMVHEHPFHNPFAYVLHCLETGLAIDGPLSPAIARLGQQIVDTAVLSV